MRFSGIRSQRLPYRFQLVVEWGDDAFVGGVSYHWGGREWRPVVRVPRHQSFGVWDRVSGVVCRFRSVWGETRRDFVFDLTSRCMRFITLLRIRAAWRFARRHVGHWVRRVRWSITGVARRAFRFPRGWPWTSGSKAYWGRWAFARWRFFTYLTLWFLRSWFLSAWLKLVNLGWRAGCNSLGLVLVVNSTPNVSWLTEFTLDVLLLFLVCWIHLAILLFFLFALPRELRPRGNRRTVVGLDDTDRRFTGVSTGDYGRPVWTSRAARVYSDGSRR